jgi:hypothetical protein
LAPPCALPEISQRPRRTSVEEGGPLQQKEEEQTTAKELEGSVLARKMRLGQRMKSMILERRRRDED